MIEYRFIDPPGIHFVEGRGSFNLLELFKIGVDVLQRDGPAGDLSRPTLWDVREVNLLDFKTHELKSLIRKRIALGEQYRNSLMAVVVGDEGSYGMMRMYNSLAEINGLRPVEATYLGFDFDEAIQWITMAMKLDQRNAADFQSTILASELASN